MYSNGIITAAEFVHNFQKMRQSISSICKAQAIRTKNTLHFAFALVQIWKHGSDPQYTC